MWRDQQQLLDALTSGTPPCPGGTAGGV